ncbi:MAG: Ppx/GppA phosphatase family protein, partial [Myxococcaceae bacterium]
MSRLAAVDVGTNSVLLLVAERGDDGVLRPVREEAEITRLGRGVDRSGVLSAEGLETTLEVLGRFAEMARRSGARALVVTATSAARDASNGAEFLARARERTGATVEILAGDEEARLSYLAVAQDFAADAGEAGLLAIDVGGGSTEFVHGHGRTVLFRKSLDIGSVRLTERSVRSDPPTEVDQEAVRGAVRDALRTLPAFPPEVRVVGVAGTVTSLLAIAHRVEPYDAARVHGS